MRALLTCMVAALSVRVIIEAMSDCAPRLCFACGAGRCSFGLPGVCRHLVG